METKKKTIEYFISVTNRILTGDKCFEPHYDELNQILKELNEMYERTGDDENCESKDEEISNMSKRINNIGEKYSIYHWQGSTGTGIPPSWNYLIFG